eukprot:12876422-Alexandrium_andersonii.AAC.1
MVNAFCEFTRAEIVNKHVLRANASIFKALEDKLAGPDNSNGEWGTVLLLTLQAALPLKGTQYPVPWLFKKQADVQKLKLFNTAMKGSKAHKVCDKACQAAAKIAAPKREREPKRTPKKKAKAKAEPKKSPTNKI